jgi:2-oxoglutarate dehydrogenase E2 component (dihydrolipoamide succinyltransferase)
VGEIKVPQLGESVVEATIARWVKSEGDRVELGEAVVELETEKVNVEVAAEEAGVLERVLHGEGDTVKVGETLGVIGEGNAVAGSEHVDAETAATPSASAVIADTPDDAATVTPVARRVAEEHGIDPATILGSGPGGRVTKDDVIGKVNGPVPAAVASAVPMAPSNPTGSPSLLPAASAPSPTSNGRPEERVPLTRRRATIARRLVEAQQTAALLTTFNEVDMTSVMELRKRRRDTFKERHGVSLGFMSFFTKACIGALKAFPNVNAELQGDTLVLKRYYDIGIAVSTDDGLVVPILRDANELTFAEIEKRIGELAGRARSRELRLDELQGGTFTITNGGVFGSLLSTPILNPPQVGILGMHKIEERPIAQNGQVVIRPMMYLALTYDHRVIDGREAVTFLVRVKDLIEDPETLLLEG